MFTYAMSSSGFYPRHCHCHGQGSQPQLCSCFDHPTWLWDSCDSYRLNREIIQQFLTGLFGSFNFLVEVSDAKDYLKICLTYASSLLMGDLDFGFHRHSLRHVHISLGQNRQIDGMTRTKNPSFICIAGEGRVRVRPEGLIGRELIMMDILSVTRHVTKQTGA
jgi:hypothetical protein